LRKKGQLVQEISWWRIWRHIVGSNIDRNLAGQDLPELSGVRYRDICFETIGAVASEKDINFAIQHWLLPLEVNVLQVMRNRDWNIAHYLKWCFPADPKTIFEQDVAVVVQDCYVAGICGSNPK
jgi:hypothetical protein